MDNKYEEIFPLLRLFKYMQPYQSKAILATVCTLLNNIFDVLPDLLLGMAIDVVVNKNDSFLASFGIQKIGLQLAILGGLTLFLWCAEALFEYLSEVLWRNLAQMVQHSLRTDAYGHMQSLEMAYF